MSGPSTQRLLDIADECSAYPGIVAAIREVLLPDAARREQEGLREAYLRLLVARHDTAHRGGIFDGGPTVFTCALCMSGMVEQGITEAVARAALDGNGERT